MAIHRLKPGSLGAIAVTLAFLAAPAALSQAPKEDLHLAIKALLETPNNVVRLGIQAVEGTDTATAQRLELELIQLATDAGFNVLTPEKVKQQLAKAQETAQNINANTCGLITIHSAMPQRPALKCYSLCAWSKSKLAKPLPRWMHLQEKVVSKAPSALKPCEGP